MSVKLYRSGFTIVELLIVIIVIAILAAISIVGYSGIQNRARISSMSSALSQNAKKISIYAAENSAFPADLATAGIKDTTDITYQYTVDTSTSPGTYCLTATSSVYTYFVSDSSSGPQQGVCGGYNTLAWTKPSGTPPLLSPTLDNAVYRTASPSMRLGPGTSNTLRNSPFAGTVGQSFTVSFWIKTDASWNGTGGGSKVRVSVSPGFAYLYACPYSGPKVSWTQVTCNYTITAPSPTVNITVANDGTIGNIWIDDFSFSHT